jgi:hypothetical protein
MMFTASPPRADSLYFVDKSGPATGSLTCEFESFFLDPTGHFPLRDLVANFSSEAMQDQMA